MITRTVQAEAVDPKAGMTLDELAAFVQEALRAEVSGDALLHVRVNFKAGVKRIETRS